MMRYFLLIIVLLFSQNVCAEEINMALSKPSIDRNDMKSIKRGAKFFATNCMICHTLIYLRYDKTAEDMGITYEKMPVNVKVWPNGVKPPDLSLEADVRGVDWLYTYLHSFYLDKARPTGVNNLLVPNTMMPGIIMPYQGQQVPSQDVKQSRVVYRYVYNANLQWYDLLTLEKQGSMSPEQFDSTMADVVNFLGFAADPYHEKQKRLGWWVIGFLIILFILMYLLKKEYWKDVA